MGKEYHLNSTLGRFRLNRKQYVGDLNELISKAMPFKIEEWRDFYFSQVHSKEELEKIGTELYEKIQTIIIKEIQSINEKDCKRYVEDLIIQKTFEGRKTRFLILNNELLRYTEKQFQFLPEHPEDWRFRTHRIDYYFVDPEKDLLIGIKVCPYSMYTSQDPIVQRILKEIQETHKEFESKNAGYFFILYYTGKNTNYQIDNKEILDEIRQL